MILIDETSKENFLNSFGDNKNLLSSTFKFLFIENNELYFCLNATDEEKKVLRSIWASIRSNALLHLNVKTLNLVNKEDEKILFLQKAIELFKVKDVKLHL